MTLMGFVIKKALYNQDLNLAYENNLTCGINVEDPSQLSRYLSSSSILRRQPRTHVAQSSRQSNGAIVNHC